MKTGKVGLRNHTIHLLHDMNGHNTTPWMSADKSNGAKEDNNTAHRFSESGNPMQKEVNRQRLAKS